MYKFPTNLCIKELSDFKCSNIIKLIELLDSYQDSQFKSELVLATKKCLWCYDTFAMYKIGV